MHLKNKILVTLIAAFALVGCSSPQSGRVTKRDYDAAYTSSTLNCFAWTGTGYNVYCSLWIPVSVNHPESCELFLVDDDTGKKGWRSIPCVSYNDYKIGSNYP